MRLDALCRRRDTTLLLIDAGGALGYVELGIAPHDLVRVQQLERDAERGQALHMAGRGHVSAFGEESEAATEHQQLLVRLPFHIVPSLVALARRLGVALFTE